MTTQTPATAEIEKWLRVWFFQIFDSGSERKTQNPAGVDSGIPDPVPPLVTSPSTMLIVVRCSPTRFYIWQKTGCGIRHFCPSKQKTGNAGCWSIWTKFYWSTYF